MLLELGDGEIKPKTGQLRMTAGRHALLVVLCALWLLPGLVMRAPWKPVETVIVQVVEESYGRASESTPMLLGRPYPLPPLYLQAAGMARRFFAGPLFSRHEAMRLGNLIWLAVALAGVALAAGRGRTARDAWRAVLLMVGCLGLLVPVRLLNPDLALLAAAAGITWALTCMRTQPLLGGFALALAGGLGLLAAGITAPVMAVLALCLPPLCWSSFRSRAWLKGSLAAMATGGVLSFFVVGWVRAGGSVEALLAGLREAPLAGLVLVLRISSWAAWPTLPLAILVIVACRADFAQLPDHATSGAALVAAIMAFVFASAHTESAVFALIPPAAVLAAIGIDRIAREVTKMFDYFSIALLGFGLLGLLWLVWLGAVIGWPERLVAWLVLQGLREPLAVNWLALAGATIATGSYAGWLAKLGQRPDRMVLNWTVGLVMAWIVFSLLWLPTVDRLRNYEDMAAKLNARLPPVAAGCIARAPIMPVDSVAQMAYFTGREFLSLDEDEGTACRWLIDAPGSRPGWRQIVRVGRLGGPPELALYERNQNLSLPKFGR